MTTVQFIQCSLRVVILFTKVTGILSLILGIYCCCTSLWFNIQILGHLTLYQVSPKIWTLLLSVDVTKTAWWVDSDHLLHFAAEFILFAQVCLSSGYNGTYISYCIVTKPVFLCMQTALSDLARQVSPDMCKMCRFRILPHMCKV